MSNVISDAFSKAAHLALEDWGMMLIDDSDSCKSHLDEPEDLLIGTMEFRGLASGTIAVLCPIEFLRALCVNVLGAQSTEEVSSVEFNDALKELTNVLTGRFLTEAYGEDTVFDLVSPTVHSVDQESLTKFFELKPRYCYSADDEFISVGLGPIGCL